ncbi:MAG TPA: tetraacyldisaccharide 4'-kinase [Candidatus Dormibacteraeota bacterium]|nr:tetraacyldisaccharide 4'-kinase [Candidatus Dormibacteraeota bacterium]
MSVESHLREAVWPRRGLRGWVESLALQPFSAVFGLGVGLRGTGYRLGLLRVRRAPVPVVSVGNLAVGGTGKTPVTLWVAEGLRARGARPAIVSRGYGGSARGATVVSRGNGPEVGPEIAGDEPVMLAKSFAGPVVVSPRRIEGATVAAALGCDVVVLDDGFQHRAIARDFDLVLLDGRRGALLPAGPFREPLGAAARADALLLMGRDEHDAVEAPSGLHVAQYHAHLEASAVVESVAGAWHTHAMGRLAGRRVIAVTGIARPEPFYALLQRWDATIEEVFEYPDHHRYSAEQWQRIARRGHDVDLIVTTEKDLVKLEAFPFATGKLVALRIAPRVQHGAALLDDIAARVGLPPRSAKETPDGHQ